MKCVFCAKEVGTVDEAVELGWLPDFWQGDVTYDGPVCPECGKEHLFAADTGDFELKPGHPVPSSAKESGFIVTKKEESMPIVKPKFELGQVVATPGALEALEESGQSPAFFLDRHSRGDWGEVCEEDRQANDEALTSGERLLSAYKTLKGARIWIITEAVGDDGKRAASTLLLPSEY